MKPFLTLAALLFVGAIAAAPVIAATAVAPEPPPRGEPGPRATGSDTLNAEQVTKVKAVLSAYKPATLTADDAKAIKRALRDAGMRRSAALDAAITAAGFSPDRLEALDPRPPQPPGGSDAPAGPPPRK